MKKSNTKPTPRKQTKKKRPPKKKASANSSSPKKRVSPEKQQSSRGSSSPKKKTAGKSELSQIWRDPVKLKQYIDGQRSKKSSKENVSKYVRTLRSLGVEITDGDPEAIGDCPFCDKQAHLYMNVASGQWDCKSCKESGNIYSFLQKTHQLTIDCTTAADYERLDCRRKISNWTAKQHGLAFSSHLRAWLLPFRNAEGAIVNLLRYYENTGDKRMLGGLSTCLYGLERLSDDIAKVLFLVEGPFDAISLDQHLQNLKVRDDYDILAVPGATTFKKEWAKHLENRTVRIVYDNDEAGIDGTQTVIKRLRSTATKATLECFQWTEEHSNGYDISDLVQVDGVSIPSLTADSLETIELDGVRDEPKGKASMTLASRPYQDIKPQEVEWLWAERIALGKLTLLVGQPGLGKTFLACDLAARVSCGECFPDGSLPPIGDVAILTAEDGASDTLRPRLDAAGADVSKVHHIDGVRVANGEQHFLSLDKDLRAIERWIVTHPEANLFIIDPISAFLGDIDSHRNSDVRAVLGPLADLADRHNIAVLGVTHLSKGQTKAINRIIGSIAFVAASRAAWLLAEDPDDNQRRLFLQVKNNLGKAGGLAFHFEGDKQETHIVWNAEPVLISVDDIDDTSERTVHLSPRGKHEYRRSSEKIDGFMVVTLFKSAKWILREWHP